MRTFVKTVSFFVLFLVTVGVSVLWAAWVEDGAPICKETGNQQYSDITSDGAGGSIIAWQDYRSGSYSDIYAQRIDASGAVKWTANGVAICTATSDQLNPQITSDGAGGAIITWYDYRNGGMVYSDIYAQRIDASGAIKWTANGVAICTASFAQSIPQLIPDGSGGAIITWKDYRGSSYDIYAQRVNASGTVQWTADGVAICTASQPQINPQLTSDGAGGAIITWVDDRAWYNGSWYYDIYAQRVNASGTVQWTSNGVAICTAIWNQQNPQITSDGAGGAIITWQDRRNSGNYCDIYAQRVNASGSVQWTTDGVGICTARTAYDPQITSDGAGGAIITWSDWSSGHSDIYTQRVNASGTVQWTANGVATCTATLDQLNPQITSDGAGGAIITWFDYRNSTDYNIYAQRVTTSGAVQWTSDGVALCAATLDQMSPQITSDGAGGAIITWFDYRNGTDYDIYAQRILALGNLPLDMPPQVTLVRPNGGEVFYAFTQDTIRWIASDSVGVTSVSIYYSTNGGSTYPYTIATDEPNDSTYVWSVPYRNTSNCKVKVVAYDAASNEASDTSDNTFTITLDVSPPEVTVIKPNGGEVFHEGAQDTIRWIATDNVGVDSVSLYYSTDGGSTYPYTIATSELNDSTYIWTIPSTLSNTCKVKVVAYDVFESEGSDTSDNDFTIAAPADLTPPQVTVVRPNGSEVFSVGSQDTIRWIATDNVAVDSVTIYYSIDGGATFPFTVASGEPNDSVYVWTVADTPSDSCVIRIVAYDPSLNTGQDISDAYFSIQSQVGAGLIPEVTRFGLLENHPNPFNPMTRIEFGLDRDAKVYLRIYDVSGKIVRTLVQESLAAGRHTAIWNGEDEAGGTVASGIYICRLEAEGKMAMHKLVLLK